MHKLKSINLVFFCFVTTLFWNGLFPVTIEAQNMGYNELFEQMDDLTNEQVYSRLKKHQLRDPYFANTYVQLGNIAQKIGEELDPLREIDRVKYWIDIAILYYELFPSYLESNEVRRNEDLYSNLPIEFHGRRIDNEDVTEYVEERVQYCNNFRDSLEIVYETIEKSKDHYNNCVRVFNEINDEFPNLNEALLKTDSDFLLILEEIESEFDKTLDQFDAYKKLLEEFPVGDYDQSYNLKRINTFRLDGITNSDFLGDTFNIWNYREWVKRYIAIYENDIVSLRNEIENIQSQFDNNLQKLGVIDFADPDMALESFDDLFLFRLGKYDNNSLIRELFNYLDGRQKLLLMSKNELNNSADSALTLMNRKLRYYYRLALQMNRARNGLDNFHASIRPEKVNRFSLFFDSYYQGEPGLQKFYNEQNDFLWNIYNRGLNSFKTYFENEESVRDAYEYAEIKSGSLMPLHVVDERSEDFDRLNYITKNVFFLDNIPAYVSGYIKKSDRNVPFVAKIAAGTEDVEWVREIDIEMDNSDVAEQSVQNMFAYENGVIVLASALVNDFDKDAPGTIDHGDSEMKFKNILVHFDETGKNVLKRGFDNSYVPIFLKYDEINQLSLLAFGKNVDKDSGLYDNISICQVDSAGAKLWDTTLDVRGRLVDIVRGEDKYIAYLNYLDPGFEKNAEMTEEKWACLTTDISFDGSVVNNKSVITRKSFYIDRIFSISSDEINLIGYTGQPFDKTGDLIYFIIGADGELVFQNL